MNNELHILESEREFLQYVDALELHRRISDFRTLDFKRLSYGDIQRAILDVITFDTPHGRRARLHPRSAKYPMGTRFFRARTIPEDDRNLPLRSMSKVGDCWEPPAEIVDIGRLNKRNEPLLYTVPRDPRIATEELRIHDDEFFSLIVYEAKEEINVTVIGDTPNVEGLDDDEILKSKMIQDFLRHEFVRDVGKGTEYLYKISESIAKDYFDLPPELQDAWCYPSIAANGGFNVAFRPQTRSKLRLVGVQIAKVNRIQDWDFTFGVYVVAGKTEGTDDLSYFSVGSPEQHEMFPEIQTETPAPMTWSKADNP